MGSITGIVKRVEELVNVTDTFKKRNLIITTEEQYPQTLQVEFIQDKVVLLDAILEGEKLNVHYNLRGREVEKVAGEPKVFNSLHGWKIEKV
ncbi:MAG: DUF3127 domain-containing protein [Flavobacteriales bacterium]|jgi:single-strand DNA-binding protein